MSGFTLSPHAGKELPDGLAKYTPVYFPNVQRIDFKAVKIKKILILTIVHLQYLLINADAFFFFALRIDR